MSTLCAGCGHDSVTAAIIRAFWELSIPPHRVAKLSGIGCSSKTPTYFLREAHGFNSVHGRMPSIATGAGAANRDLIMIGISGDGDSLSIGLGQFCHAMRRGVRMLYVLENNGVYGLTKGQFSASADVGTKAKRGEVNRNEPIDPVLLALSLGATFVARSFSGDREQLVPILKAGLAHRGFAFIDVISPCVTFNDHEGSTKSYRFTRDHMREVIAADFTDGAVRDGGLDGAGNGHAIHADPGDETPAESPDLVPIRTEITAAYAPGSVHEIRMHDGSTVRLRKIDENFESTDRDAVYAYVRERQRAGEIPTGLLYMEPEALDMHAMEGTVARPLVDLAFESLCPGAGKLDALMEEFR
ncbi:MAG: 2-oxoacid:ferredoxin oxidoreductase subunit beta [Gemmatimonadetes bacterium]|nr:2-oxoacid:ferredoxin oxidoreductase subunit beta [Gemmatimonadota bacterium]